MIGHSSVALSQLNVRAVYVRHSFELPVVEQTYLSLYSSLPLSSKHHVFIQAVSIPFSVVRESPQDGADGNCQVCLFKEEANKLSTTETKNLRDFW